MKTIYLVAGARPNFMKIAPIARAFAEQGRIRAQVIHTGQHYDREMNDVFFEELGIPQPYAAITSGSGTHAEQTARIMLAFETLCQKDRPDGVVVVGDVNSTMACAIAAKKLHIPVAHVEAGLRSGDMNMPEEVNRVLTDAISDWYFVTEEAAVKNLLHEGKRADRVHHVGHVMIDNLMYQFEKLIRLEHEAMQSHRIKRALLEEYGCFGVVTLHRPANIDHRHTLASLICALRTVAQHIPLVFPVHPRTRRALDELDQPLGNKIVLTGPMSYMEFLNLWRDASVVLTDSGGLQEETTALGIPCLTLRDNTERPVTVDIGSNILVGTDPERIKSEAMNVFCGKGKRGQRPALWDGKAAHRIAAILAAELTA